MHIAHHTHTHTRSSLSRAYSETGATCNTTMRTTSDAGRRASPSTAPPWPQRRAPTPGAPGSGGASERAHPKYRHFFPN
jgi:hypothetical protein